VLKEGDVEPDDVPSVTATHSGVDQTVKCKIKAARGPESMPTELAGPESVPFADWPGSFGSAGALPAEAILGGPGGHADPTAVRIAPESLDTERQSEVLPGSGVSCPVDVGTPAAAVAAAVAVGDPVERLVSVRNSHKVLLSPQISLLPLGIALSTQPTYQISHI